LQGGTLTNTGTITGGAGGSGNEGHVGAAGTGIYISGATLITSGTIGGGAGHPAANAVSFGSTAGTLVIDPGAVFNGLVVASTSAPDTLVLGGTTAATLTGLGTAFTKFATLDVQSHADWSLTGSNTLGTGTVLAAGTLTVGTGSLLAAGLTLDGGSIGASGAGEIVIGASARGAQAGALTVQSAAIATGAGTITGAVLDDGALNAMGGKLTVDGALSGTGTATIESGATLLASGAVSGVTLDFAAAGTLALGSLTSVTSTISGFGTGDVVTAENLKATTLTYSGGTLTLENGSQAVGQLLFSGSYTTADFTLKSIAHGGTEILYQAAGAADFSGLTGAVAPPHAMAADGVLGGISGAWDHTMPAWSALLLHPGRL
jgi:hypothetical protein